MKEPIIKSLLDADLYKFTVQRVFLHYQPTSIARYDFKCRNEGIIWTDKMVQEIKEELKHVATLRFTEDEIQYLMNMYFMKDAQWYGEFLKIFQLDYNNLNINLSSSGQLEISASGVLWNIMMWEIFVLSVVNEVYFRNISNYDLWRDNALLNLKAKVKLAKESKLPLNITDFGTRRRYSRKWHEEVLQYLIDETRQNPGNFNFIGTSNSYYAKKFNIKNIGTFGHEGPMSVQGIESIPVANSQKEFFKIWQQEYKGSLGICLTDTFGMQKFLKDFTKDQALLYDGVRHDSLCPFQYGEDIIKMYKGFGIDPKTKTIVYSDGLDIPKCIELADRFEDRIKISFGVGTNLTNDGGIPALNIVMKMTENNGRPIAKLASEGKIMCKDEKYVEYLRYAINN